MPVKRLQPGEKVKLNDTTTEVESLTPREQPEAVYNLDVDADHVYRVTDSGLLVHNQSCPLNFVADSNVFLDRPGLINGFSARAIFDDIIADPRFNILLVKGVATAEILPTPSQISRLAATKATIQKVRSANVAPLLRADPLIASGKFGINDLKVIQTAVKRGLPVVTSNRKMVDQITTGPSALRRNLYGGGKVEILIPGQHFMNADELATLLL